MPTIEGELRSSTEVATECDDLDGFTCGDGRLVAEAAVGRIVNSCRTGKLPNATLRVTREMPAGALVGLAAIEWPGLVLRHPALNGDAFSDSAYIAVLSLAEEYRGGYKTSNGEPVSHALMRDALNHIAAKAEGEIPPVQAIIDPNNTPSRTLCEEFGFVRPIETEPDVWYMRPRGLPIEGPVDEKEATGEATPG